MVRIMLGWDMWYVALFLLLLLLLLLFLPVERVFVDT
jgi:hypothetical protein